MIKTKIMEVVMMNVYEIEGRVYEAANEYDAKREGIMKYIGIAQNTVTGQEWNTKAYNSYEVAHRAAEKLANKHIPEGNAYIYVVDDDMDDDVNIEIKQAGKNFVAIVNGTHYWFGFYRSGYYELQANKFYYRIPADYTMDDVKRALAYCGAI